MNIKEVGEIRRRLRRDRSNMTAIYGCYVRANQEIISEFKASLATLPENEADKYMALFKRVLGGTLGKALTDITFTTKQVANREERYNLLSELRRTRLGDKDCRHAFYERVINSLNLYSNYVILLGCDTYDVPFKSKNDERCSDASDESFTYIICAICPVKDTTPNLHYVHQDATFHDSGMLQAVKSPAVGFMFPAFDNRSTNLYGALFSNKSTTDPRAEFVDAVFGTTAAMSADSEMIAFNTLLSSKLAGECSLDVIQSIHEQASARVQLHKESRNAEPLTVDSQEICSILSASGVSHETASAFSDAFKETFGAGSRILLENIIDTKHYFVTAPDVVIKVAPDRAQNVELRTIGGRNYVMILADGDVEVNGIQLTVPDNE